MRKIAAVLSVLVFATATLGYQNNTAEQELDVFDIVYNKDESMKRFYPADGGIFSNFPDNNVFLTQASLPDRWYRGYDGSADQLYFSDRRDTVVDDGKKVVWGRYTLKRRDGSELERGKYWCISNSKGLIVFENIWRTYPEDIHQTQNQTQNQT